MPLSTRAERVAAYQKKMLQLLRKADKVDAKGIAATVDFAKRLQAATLDRMAVVARKTSKDGYPPWGVYWVPQIMGAVARVANSLAQEFAMTLQELAHESFDIGRAIADTAELLAPGLSINIPEIDPNTVKIGAQFSADLITNMAQKQIGDVSGEIAQSLALGEPLSVLMDKLEPLVGKGPWKSAAYRAEIVARTELARIQGLATQLQMEQISEENPELELKRQYLVAHVQEWPCDECRPHDGNVYEIDGTPYLPADGPPAPSTPVHPNCRCCYVPWFADIMPRLDKSRPATLSTLGADVPTDAQEKQSERLDEALHQYASTQVDMPADLARSLMDLAKMEIPESIVQKYEDDPHVTVLYGLIDPHPDMIKDLVAGARKPRITFGRMGVFFKDEFDVVKLDIYSPELFELNRRLSAMENANTYPVYSPHLTLAYVKPGEGLRFAGRPVPFSGLEIELSTLMLSSKDEKKFPISLGVGV